MAVNECRPISNTKPPPGVLRRLALPATALGLGAALCLGGLELAARVLDLAPPLPDEYSDFATHSVLPWVLRPNAERTAAGFRGPERESEKPPGTFRIVGVGDSFTYGMGMPSEVIFLARLEAALAERGRPPVEVINLGIPGYWPEPEALVLQHYGLRYQPDLVLVGVYTNDFQDTASGSPRMVRRGYLVSSRARRMGDLGFWLYRRSHVARVLLAHRLARARYGVDTARARMEDDPETVWAWMQEAWGRMADMTRAADARIAFIHLPSGPPPRQGPQWGNDPAELPRRLRQVCATRECSVIDTLPAFTAHPAIETLYFPDDDIRYSAAGHALVADVILRDLESRGLLPD